MPKNVAAGPANPIVRVQNVIVPSIFTKIGEKKVEIGFFFSAIGFRNFDVGVWNSKKVEF